MIIITTITIIIIAADRKWLVYLQVFGQHVGYEQTEKRTGKQTGLLILQNVGK